MTLRSEPYRIGETREGFFGRENREWTRLETEVFNAISRYADRSIPAWRPFSTRLLATQKMFEAFDRVVAEALWISEQLHALQAAAELENPEDFRITWRVDDVTSILTVRVIHHGAHVETSISATAGLVAKTDLVGEALRNMKRRLAKTMGRRSQETKHDVDPEGSFT